MMKTEIETQIETRRCYPCWQSGGEDVAATHAGCQHLGAHDHIDGVTWGLCDECHAAGPCPECEEDAERDLPYGVRPLTHDEAERIASGEGVADLAVTCRDDRGYGPCGSYMDWTDGQCACGHPIGIVAEEQA